MSTKASIQVIFRDCAKLEEDVFVTWVECDIERKMMLNKKMLRKENKSWVRSELKTLTSFNQYAEYLLAYSAN